MAVATFERTFEDELALAMLRAARRRAAVPSLARGSAGAAGRAAGSQAAAPGVRGAGGGGDDVTDSERLGRRFR